MNPNASFLTVEMEDGSEILLQNAVRSGGPIMASSDPKKSVRFEELANGAIKQAAKFASAVKDALVGESSPDEVELALSVGFSGEAKAILASTEVSTGLKVCLKWSKEK